MHINNEYCFQKTVCERHYRYMYNTRITHESQKAYHKYM